MIPAPGKGGEGKQHCLLTVISTSSILLPCGEDIVAQNEGEVICKLETIANQTSTAHGTWGPPSRERQRHAGTDFPPSLARCPWERLTRTGRCHQITRRRKACAAEDRPRPSLDVPRREETFSRCLPVPPTHHRGRPGNGLGLPFADLAGGSAFREGLYPHHHLPPNISEATYPPSPAPGIST